MIKNPFASKNNASAKAGASAHLKTSISADGVVFSSTPQVASWLTSPATFGTAAETVRFLAQLEEAGFADFFNSHLAISWESLYAIADSPEYCDAFGLLGLPPVAPWRPVLESRGGFADKEFSLILVGWKGPDGRMPSGNISLEGGCISIGSSRSLISRAAWETANAIAVFHRQRQAAGGALGADGNRKAWAMVRAKATAAGADLSDFLRRTVVLTPDRLDIDLRKGDGIGTQLVEVLPSFEGGPVRWLEIFDRSDEVKDRYEIPDGDDGAGLVHVVVAPEVRTVLREIKRMPGRRIAGERAEAFIRNPFAILGPDADKVVDPGKFERAREAAGITFARFTAKVSRDAHGYPYEAALLVEESLGGDVRSDIVKFETTADISAFLSKLDAKIQRGAQCCPWNGYELEILGDTSDQANILRAALAELSSPKGWRASEILDLKRYSERVESFGVEKPYYSPFIARKNEDAGWFPENVEFGVCFTPEGGETVAVALNESTLGEFSARANKARDEGVSKFEFPGCPKPVPVDWADEILRDLGDTLGSIKKGQFDPSALKAKGDLRERKGLVVKPNVEALDYAEIRGGLALPEGLAPTIPNSLRQEISLKDHQKAGLAWLQFLWSKSPTECRGALLADDMGLGKTVQLLAFMASVLEESSEADPFLVVAPVSLLENWCEEMGKFFAPDALPVLTLYGNDLADKRLPKAALDQELNDAGITKLLRRDWLGGAKIVLTTYETLRDLEFSLAAQKWSAIICDEAQKIKNPNAMVTRAAKKQNARFKIACTGTPVENTLTDIWCLFDFVQPGLLGALKDFGERYRKPIEAETDEEKARVNELKALTGPQLLRRTKAEVAKDLPKKIEVTECRALRISDRQRALYAQAVGSFRNPNNNAGGGRGSSHLGLLQYLRKLCSDPVPPGLVTSEALAMQDILAHSPKMAWLVAQLAKIRSGAEKAIVFCEFKHLQRTIQRVVEEHFGFSPDVINGDTSASSANANNRQKRIRDFQEAPGFGVIILSPLAVGFGVNIQAANHVIHFTRTWNPAKEDQATDRAYRIGQKKDVYVYYPVVVADDFITFDAKLDALLNWKRGLSTEMLNGAGECRPSDFDDLGAPGGGSAFGEDLVDVEDLHGMEHDAFEAFCTILWSKLGYPKTFRTPATGDGGIDVVAISGKTGVLIQCKSSSVDGKELGWEAVKDVVAGTAAYSAQFPGVRFTRAAVTNKRFNSSARMQALLNHVELVDIVGLAERLKEKPVRWRELSSCLFSGW